MNDVLIYADRVDVEHKLRGNLADEHDRCYWTVSGTPRQTEPGCRVLFTDGERVHAAGEITDVEDGRLWFDPLERVDEELPCEPTTRGFKYVKQVG